jgi:hypothetical protein
LNPLTISKNLEFDVLSIINKMSHLLKSMTSF